MVSSQSSLKCQDNKWLDSARTHGARLSEPIVIQKICLRFSPPLETCLSPCMNWASIINSHLWWCWYCKHYSSVLGFLCIITISSSACLSTSHFTPLCFALLSSLYTETFLIVPAVLDLDRHFGYVTGPCLWHFCATLPLFPSLVFIFSCIGTLIVQRCWWSSLQASLCDLYYICLCTTCQQL